MKNLIVILTLLSFSCNSQNTMETNKNYNPLNDFEKSVIINKSTERPFTGEYVNHKETGVYVCKQCNAPLYKSDDKFDSHCGWPSFDDEIAGAVNQIPDKDGMRTEIVCANCNGHLGHVFIGEKFTEKNTRHCVNSVSLKFIPKSGKKTEKAIFAGGCFWGVEYYFQNKNGVLETEVGYSGGKVENPSYKDVCTKNTGHAEVLQATFNPDVVSFEELAKLFFEIHDPTQQNRQGPDIGEQYRSEIFYVNDKQKEIALDLIRQLKAKGYDVQTGLTKFEKFWSAEDYHQEYYSKKDGEPYCHFYRKRF